MNYSQGIDLVAVVDTSNSMMADSKIVLVKQTLLYILRNLEEKDYFCLVSYSEKAHLVFPLKQMTTVNKKAAVEAILEITLSRWTNLHDGLFTGLHQLENKSSNLVRSIFLMTDGQPTIGEQNTNNIVSELSDRLDTFEVHYQNRPSVFTFGYGNRAKQTLLTEVSNVAGGSYYFIEKPKEIREAFGDCLGGLLSVYGQKIALKVEACDGVKINKVLGRHKVVRNEGEIDIFLGDIYSEEVKDILLEVELSPTETPGEYDIAHIQMEYLNTTNAQNEHRTCHCKAKRNKILKQAFMEMDYDVSLQLNRIVAAEAMLQSIDYNTKDFGTIKNIIQQAITSIQNSVSAEDSFSIELIQSLSRHCLDIEHEVHKAVVQQRLYAEAYAHLHQRSTIGSEFMTDRYRTQVKANTINQFKHPEPPRSPSSSPDHTIGTSPPIEISPSLSPFLPSSPLLTPPSSPIRTPRDTSLKSPFSQSLGPPGFPNYTGDEYRKRSNSGRDRMFNSVNINAHSHTRHTHHSHQTDVQLTPSKYKTRKQATTVDPHSYVHSAPVGRKKIGMGLSHQDTVDYTTLDVFLLGNVFFQCFTGFTPFAIMAPTEPLDVPTVQEYLSCRSVFIPEVLEYLVNDRQLSRESVNFLQYVLCSDPSLKEISQHPFFRSLDLNSTLNKLEPPYTPKPFLPNV
uniref:VWFA domain-containing protein n=1 Tax=Arcella intermedia TaxID=1963864 RepID=A0A6B2KZ73_9EUKA